MTAQKFGGPWSLKKLEIVEQYLRPFCTSLGRRFNLVYIDAFAGSGSFSFRESTAAPLFDQAEVVKSVNGSARIALSCNPPFASLYFIEQKRSNVVALQTLKSQNPSRKIDVLKGDANELIESVCKKINWKNSRGVLFLDPFGNSVEWSTLMLISRTRAVDVWYLFPLSGVYRQAAIDPGKLTEEKRASISKVLGTNEWEQYFYQSPFAPTDDLFGHTNDAPKRTVNADGILAYVTKRLESVFPYVAPPKILLGPNNAPLYALYLTLSNPEKSAISLAKRISQND